MNKSIKMLLADQLEAYKKLSEAAVAVGTASLAIQNRALSGVCWKCQKKMFSYGECRSHTNQVCNIHRIINL